MSNRLKHPDKEFDHESTIHINRSIDNEPSKRQRRQQMTVSHRRPVSGSAIHPDLWKRLPLATIERDRCRRPKFANFRSFDRCRPHCRYAHDQTHTHRDIDWHDELQASGTNIFISRHIYIHSILLNNREDMSTFKALIMLP